MPIAGAVQLGSGAELDPGAVRRMLAAMSGGNLDVEPPPFATFAHAVVGAAPSACEDPGVVARSATGDVVCFGDGDVLGLSGGTSLADRVLDAYLSDRLAEALGCLRGAFSVAIVDSRNGATILATDTLSSRPIFTVTVGDTLFFASEIKGLLAVDEVPNDADLSSVASYLLRGFMVNRKTLVRGIRQLDYATRVRIAGGVVDEQPFWRFQVRPSANRSDSELAEELERLMRQAVARSCPDSGVMVSGGLDSRAILACLEDPAALPLICYTSREEGNWHPHSDLAVAEKIADQLGATLEVVSYDPKGMMEAIAESAYIGEGAAGFVFENVWSEICSRSGIRAILVGDECFGHCAGPIADSQVLARAGLSSLGDGPQVLSLLAADVRGSMIEELERDRSDAIARSDAATPAAKVDEVFYGQRSVQFVAPKRRLPRARGCVPRTPWLDRDLLDFVRKLPDGRRKHKSLFKKTLGQLAPDLMALPLARVGETPDYRQYLREWESAERLVSQVAWEDNPLRGELFDAAGVRALIGSVCGGPAESGASGRPGLRGLVPIQWQRTLAAWYRFVFRPAPVLPAVTLLLRLMTISVALQMLGERFKGKFSKVTM